MPKIIPRSERLDHVIRISNETMEHIVNRGKFGMVANDVILFALKRVLVLERIHGKWAKEN